MEVEDRADNAECMVAILTAPLLATGEVMGVDRSALRAGNFLAITPSDTP
jgi:hypothetical protein